MANTTITDQFTQAVVAFKSGEYARCIARCEAILRAEPTHKQALALAGDAAVVSKQLDSASSFYIRALALDETDGTVQFKLGNVCLGQAQYQDAITCYAKAETYGVSDADLQKIYYLLATLHHESGDDAQALHNCDRAFAIKGKHPDTQALLALRSELHLARGAFAQARADALALKMLCPQSFESYQRLFQIQMQQHDAEAAKATLAEAVKMCDLTADVDMNIICYYVLVDLLRAQVLDVANAEAHYETAIARVEAFMASRSALRVADTYELIITKAELHLKLERIDEAVALAQRVVDHVGPLSAAALDAVERGRFLLSEIAMQRGDAETAARYAKLLKRSKQQPTVLYGYFTEAVAMHQRAQADGSSARDALAVYERAIAYFRSVSAQNPSDIIAYTYRAKLYACMGRYEKARELAQALPCEAQARVETYIAHCQSQNGAAE